MKAATTIFFQDEQSSKHLLSVNRGNWKLRTRLLNYFWAEEIVGKRNCWFDNSFTEFRRPTRIILFCAGMRVVRSVGCIRVSPFFFCCAGIIMVVIFVLWNIVYLPIFNVPNLVSEVLIVSNLFPLGTWHEILLKTIKKILITLEKFDKTFDKRDILLRE